MAIVESNDAFTQPYFNLNAVWKNKQYFYFFDDQPYDYWGKTYRDAFEIDFEDNGSYLLLQFAGRRIAATDAAEASTDNEMKGGTIQGVFLDLWVNGGWTDIWGIRGFDIAATEVMDALKTKRTGDDAKVFKTIFKGDDTFDLSRFDDTAIGFGGADEMLGRGGADALFGDRGNDMLRGGKGSDTLDGGRGKDTLHGGKGADAFLFGKGYDRDVIRDFADDTDRLVLASDLWNGDLTRRKVVDKFAVEKGGNVVFDFGDDRLVVQDIADKASLIDDITIV